MAPWWLSSERRPAVAVSGDDERLRDVLFEAMLPFPASDIRRLRLVCPSWRDLTADPVFVRAHVSRHPDPLIAVAFRGGGGGDDAAGHGVSIADLSGNVLKQIRITDGDHPVTVLPTCLDVVCISRKNHSGSEIVVLDAATRATVASLTQCSHQNVKYAFGKVASTGEYKGISIINGDRQLCEVMTLDGSNNGSWRRKQDPPVCISSMSIMKTVVIDGVVYFLAGKFQNLNPVCIASFNMETEVWMPTLEVPQQIRNLFEGVNIYVYYELYSALSLANLKEYLVTAHNVSDVSVDLWFLMDYESCLWDKKYSINVQLPQYNVPVHVYPFLALDDGRIFLYAPAIKLLQSYDPATNTCSNVRKFEMDDCTSISIYTGRRLTECPLVANIRAMVSADKKGEVGGNDKS